MAHLLGMENVPQTRRMACAIVANALVFHERIAGMHDQVQPLQLVCGDAIANPQNAVLNAWTAILKINYWPIFAIAKDLLSHLPAGDAATILRRLRETAQAISATGVDQAHDLTGRIFQRLIADRKYLATFYTLPASAALWRGWPSPSSTAWIGPTPRPSASCASPTSPAVPAPCCRRCTSGWPPGTSAPAAIRRPCIR